MFGGHEAARHQFGREGRLDRSDDDDLIDVGGDELLPYAVRPPEERGARLVPLDHRLAGGRGARLDHIAAGIVVAFAAGDGVPGRLVPRNRPGNLVAAAVGGDDGGEEGFIHGQDTKKYG